MSVFRGELNKVGRDDMISLEADDNAAIMDNLKKRFQSNIIYTSIGSVVISINPFKISTCFQRPTFSSTRANTLTRYAVKQHNNGLFVLLFFFLVVFFLFCFVSFLFRWDLGVDFKDRLRIGAAAHFCARRAELSRFADRGAQSSRHYQWRIRSRQN